MKRFAQTQQDIHQTESFLGRIWKIIPELPTIATKTRQSIQHKNDEAIGIWIIFFVVLINNKEQETDSQWNSVSKDLV